VRIPLTPKEATNGMRNALRGTAKPKENTRKYRQMRQRRIFPFTLVASFAALVGVASCVGTIGDGGSGNSATLGSGGVGADAAVDGAAQQCGAPSPGAAPLRRLTQSEYNGTVRDLLGDQTGVANTFPPDQKIGDFTNTAVALTVPPLLAQAYQSAAEQLAGTAVKNLTTFVGCDPATTGEDACAQQFITTFGKRAYRRPLGSDEQTALFAVYQANRSGADFTNGIQAVVEAMLQSAAFLYRVEFGDPKQMTGSVLPLTPYEMASRLSYFMWGSMPDAALFAAADAGQLATKEQIAAQARRMIQDAKSHPAVEQFYTEWLTLNQVTGIAKDPTTYPEFTPTLQSSMLKETLAFIDWVMWQSDARMKTMLTSPVSFLNAELAAVYGVSGVTGTALQQVNLDPTQRSGLLTQLALMTVLGKADRSSPVLRGKFVRERLLCQPISPPPANIVITPPTITPGVSTRQMFSMHDKVEPCHSCHTLMDPIGFGLENYDGVGKWRTVDQGQPVDPSGTMSASDVDGPFNGAVALASKLAQSREVSDCVVTEWFRYSLGRGETADDACTMANLKQAFATANFNIQELLVALTQSDAFRFRQQVTP
jgi:hypothetical protein